MSYLYDFKIFVKSQCYYESVKEMLCTYLKENAKIIAKKVGYSVRLGDIKFMRDKTKESVLKKQEGK